MRRRILLVDDEPAILLTLSMILRSEDYEVETAKSAKEAIGKLRTHADRFQLILTDLKMESETAGLDVVHAAIEAESSAIVVIHTAYPSACVNWREHGAAALFEKPFNPDVLLEQLALLLSRKNSLPHAS